jgi:hypothetical protein
MKVEGKMAFGFGFAFAFPVFYLDPGSGSFLIQLLLAVLLGAGVAIRMYWGKIKTLLGMKKPESTEAAEEKDEE